jgi:hypothetical protein
MRYELTLYDTEGREDRVREYTESRRRAAVWALMPRIRLGGSFHHLVYRVREYSEGPKQPEISLSRFSREEQQALGELHSKVRLAKSLTGPQVELLTLLKEVDEERKAALVGGRSKLTIKRLAAGGFILAETPYIEITDKGREALKLRLLP